MTQNSAGQSGVRSWFDNQYKKRGVAYLRPPEAYRIFPEILGLSEGKKLLDVACGPGLFLSVAMAKGMKPCGVDISGEAIKISRALAPQADLSIANAEALPYHDRVFDYVTCLGSLERFIDPDRALSEQVRVTKDDGLFCYMVRNSNTFTWKFFMQFLKMQNHRAHQGAKALNEWKKIFASSGLEIVKIYHDHWPFLRLMRWITFGGKFINYGKARKSLLPLQFTTEFIFILKKKKPM